MVLVFVLGFWTVLVFVLCCCFLFLIFVFCKFIYVLKQKQNFVLRPLFCFVVYFRDSMFLVFRPGSFC